MGAYSDRRLRTANRPSSTVITRLGGPPHRDALPMQGGRLGCLSAVPGAVRAHHRHQIPDPPCGKRRVGSLPARGIAAPRRGPLPTGIANTLTHVCSCRMRTQADQPDDPPHVLDPEDAEPVFRMLSMYAPKAIGVCRAFKPTAMLHASASGTMPAVFLCRGHRPWAGGAVTRVRLIVGGVVGAQHACRVHIHGGTASGGC
jgi:hypothetical protein